MALRQHQVHLDLKLIPTSNTYRTAADLTTFVTPVPYYGDQAVRLLTGTIGALAVATGTITAISAANPAVVTCALHGLATGMSVTVTGSNSVPTINGTHTITVINANSFSVPVNTSAGTPGTAGTWTSADRRGWQTSGNFTGGEGVVLGTIAEAEIVLSEPIPRTPDGQPEFGPRLLIERMAIHHLTLSGFTVEVVHPDAAVRPTETYEWDQDLTADVDFTTHRFYPRIAAIAERCVISIGESSYKPVRITGLDWHLEVMEAWR